MTRLFFLFFLIGHPRHRGRLAGVGLRSGLAAPLLRGLPPAPGAELPVVPADRLPSTALSLHHRTSPVVREPTQYAR